MNIKTAEFVTSGHPDKICDFIADSLLDAYLKSDKESRTAIEVMGGHNTIYINGEIKSKASPDIEKIVKKIVGKDYKIISNLALQSSEIARGVDIGGAGDQGIMKGYATNETINMMPLEYELARSLCKYIFNIYPYDGKTQVTIENENIRKIVASFQNAKKEKLEKLVLDWFYKNEKKLKLDSKSRKEKNDRLENNKDFKKNIKDIQTEMRENLSFIPEIYANPAGDWMQGGFDSDTGLSGRKLIIDNYGPEIQIGGGSFSGKDYTKVDRSGAYMARKIAVDYLKKYKAKEVKTKLAYAIGISKPVMAVAQIDGNEIPIDGYDLSPAGIRKILKLEEVKFAQTTNWGHFGRDFLWDN